METRRKLKNKNDTNARVLQQLNKDINKAVRKDVRQYNTKKITTVVEENKSLKVLKRCQALGKKNIVKLADRNGKVVIDKDKIIKVDEEFYTELYRERGKKDGTKLRKVQNVGSEDIPEITIEEVSKSLNRMKNNKAAGDDQIVIEAVKVGGKTVLKALTQLYNLCLSKEVTPSQWNKAVIVVMHKKGDIRELKN
ncbi:uncharacterized protein, partial [Diabrotica undecimpunctata]|uniref:uncharacterized protein n=1 Tax=Diabrotica undecimpunctata TaxID=50387 RepID=UPI003B633E55